ncbi:MAG TPA: aminopeptidase P family protein [Blastocatellia bacterium]|nr:aminopeptidase P family protein [Blastocatellia bacterium]
MKRATRKLRYQDVVITLLATAAMICIQPAAMLRASAIEDGKLANQPKSEYSARRQKLLERIKDGVIVLVGAREEDFGEVGRFRQRNDLMYLSGVETPAAYLMLVPANLSADAAAREAAFIPRRNLQQERWTGVQIGPGSDAQQAFGIQEVAGADKFNDRLRAVLNPGTGSNGSRAQPVKIYTIVPKGPGSQLTREYLFVESLKRLAPGVEIVDLSPIIGEMRKVKSPAEIALLQKAIDISGEGHREAARTIKPGAFEYEVQAALEYAFARNGSERPGYPSIVGSGINSTILHYNQNRKRIEAGDLIVVDVGAEYSYYTADITRTFPASGKFTPRQREVYQLVLEAQRAAERAFKPGQSTMGELNQAARAAMKASSVRDKAGNTLEKYFIHGLGHFIGMDVHDVGDYAKPLPVGSVITIEPGIYIPEEKLGVRIEDDYLVTETGLVKLSAKIPSEASEIERVMSGAGAGSVRR